MELTNRGASIIISTTGRKNKLALILRSLINQKNYHYPIEIIIIDSRNKSNSRAPAYIRSFTNKITIKYYYRTNSCHSEAKNFGIIMAQYPILILLDDDIIPQNTEWLVNITRPFEKLDAKAVCGKILLNGDLPFQCGIFQSLFTHLDEGNTNKFLNLGHAPPHAHFAVLKSVLFSIGGYRRELGRRKSLLLSGEDDEVSLAISKLNFRIYYAADAVVSHDCNPSRFSKTFLFQRVFWQGITDVIVSTIVKQNRNFIQSVTMFDRKFLQMFFHRNLSFENKIMLFLPHIYSAGRMVGHILKPYYLITIRTRPLDIYRQL